MLQIEILNNFIAVIKHGFKVTFRIFVEIRTLTLTQNNFNIDETH